MGILLLAQVGSTTTGGEHSQETDKNSDELPVAVQCNTPGTFLYIIRTGEAITVHVLAWVLTVVDTYPSA